MLFLGGYTGRVRLPSSRDRCLVRWLTRDTSSFSVTTINVPQLSYVRIISHPSEIAQIVTGTCKDHLATTNDCLRRCGDHSDARVYFDDLGLLQLPADTLVYDNDHWRTSASCDAYSIV